MIFANEMIDLDTCSAFAKVLGMRTDKASRSRGRRQGRFSTFSRVRGLTTAGATLTLRPSMPNRVTSFVPVDATVVAVSSCDTGIELILILPL